MANYLYNGVELPDINEVWTDKATYPYAQLCFSDGAVIAEEYSGARVAALAISASKVTYGTYKENYFSILAPRKQYLYTDSQSVVEYYASAGLSIVCNEWSLVDESTAGNQYLTSADDETYWSNHDILNIDGTVYLAASDPVPVSTTPTVSFDLKSWLIGFALGLCGKPLPFVKKTPTGYSYNGVVLPALPEWDRGSYPYATIEIPEISFSDVYASLRFTKDKQVYNGQYVVPGENREQIYWYLPVDGTEWLGGEASEMAENGATDSVKWSSYDIVNTTDGMTYLAATEPIPIYE